MRLLQLRVKLSTGCRMRKLMYRVVFPFELKLRNTTADCLDADDTYNLLAVVVHVGSGPNHGE